MIPSCALPGAQNLHSHSTDAPLPAHTAGQHKGRSVQPLPAASLDLALATTGRSDPPRRLRVNFVADNHIPLEKRVPGPPTSAVLREDDWLAWLGSKPGDRAAPHYVGSATSLQYIQSMLAERQRLEAQGKEFCFPPLIITLENVQTFVRHIRSGQQFTAGLTPEEDAALAWVEEKTALLLNDKAPYKRTIHLVFAFVMIYTAVTHRQVMAPLQDNQPELFTGRQVLNAGSCESVRPEVVAGLCWGGNNPGAPDEKEVLFNKTGKPPMWHALACWLDDNHSFLFPSFLPLDLGEFCRFGHLPLYPVGLMTDYALNADGHMMTPLMFMNHDLEHTFDLVTTLGYPDHVMQTPLEALFCAPQQRLALRSLLLDRLPACLAALQLENPLTLLLFHLFHESYPSSAAEYLDQDYAHRQGPAGSRPFLRCLKKMAYERRARWTHYSPTFRAITDTQATEAALWTIRVWDLWQSTDFGTVSPAQLTACAHRFLTNDRPRLQTQLRFLDRHKDSLRTAFIAFCQQHNQTAPNAAFVRFSWHFGELEGATLFQAWDPEAELNNLDNTDLAYFAALYSPELRQWLEAAIGIELPQGSAEADHPAPENLVSETPGTLA